MSYDIVINGRVVRTGFTYREEAEREAETIKRFHPRADVEVLPFYG